MVVVLGLVLVQVGITDRNDAGRQSFPATTTKVGHPLLRGVPPGWQLVARSDQSRHPGPGRIIRLELAQGRITYTKIPRLRSADPVSFIAARHQVIVRPLSRVPGYSVSENDPTQKLVGALGDGGPAIPGPKPDQVWIPSRRHPHRMVLANIDGTNTGVTVRMPAGFVSTTAIPDARGYPLVITDRGAYDVRPSGQRRITSGGILAVGPNHWLTRT